MWYTHPGSRGVPSRMSSSAVRPTYARQFPGRKGSHLGIRLTPSRVTRRPCSSDEAMRLFPGWLTAISTVHDSLIRSWESRNFADLRAGARVASAQSWATLRGTRVKSQGGTAVPRLEAFVTCPALASILGWMPSVLPMLQPPYCAMPVLVTALTVDVKDVLSPGGTTSRADTRGSECMAVLHGTRHLGILQGIAKDRLKAVLVSLPADEGSQAGQVRFELGSLGLRPVLEA